MSRLSREVWKPGNRPRRLVDLLRLEPGHRIGFVDDPDGGGARLAGELLSRQVGIFVYGVVVTPAMTSPHYEDECFDVVVSAAGRRSWAMVSYALDEMHRLIRPGCVVAVTSQHPQTRLGRGVRRLPRPAVPRVRAGVAGTGSRGPAETGDLRAEGDGRDTHDMVVGHRLQEVFGSAVRTQLTTRVVWLATRRAQG